MRLLRSCSCVLLFACLPTVGQVVTAAEPTKLLAYPPPWNFQAPHAGITLVNDTQLEQLAKDPDKPVNLSVSATAQMRSLNQVCAAAQRRGVHTLSVAFDYFWAQYRREFAGKPRQLWPDTPRYIELIGKVAAVARQYGLGMKLSVLSPLEIGHGYHEQTGEQGRWYHYREGLRDPQTGAYSVQLWRQLAWTNNKGTIQLVDGGVRVFAFRERRIPNTRYYVVRPQDIVDISATAHVELMPGARTGARSIQAAGTDPAALAGYGAVRVRVHGTGKTDIGPRDRVLVVQVYRTPEMDYFSASAKPYLKNLLDRYAQAGVQLNALYADEMHVQGDWGYASHHDHGEFALRYVSPGFEQQFAASYGSQYGDFAKWLVYFCHGQHDWVNDLTGKRDAQHVLGATPAAVAQTALLRTRYFRLLNDGVIELFAGAKAYLEQKVGHPITSRAHATWAESPTIDHVAASPGGPWRWKYDYTSRFIASNTVHQSATACDDYFKWCEFLHGTGNDTAECGWLDRNYWGFALASSLGKINRVPNAYAAHWGMPAPVRQRRSALRNAWGTWPDWQFAVVQDMEPRQVDVLTLYPLDLVAWDERFGSWMTQYAYTDYLPQAQVLQLGTVTDGTLVVGRGRYTTVAIAFEPFPDKRLFTLLRQLVEQGGHVVWSGPPPILLRDGTSAAPLWQEFTGAKPAVPVADGYPAPGFDVHFSGPLAPVQPFTILTDLLPDRIYPLTPGTATEVARCGDWTVGVQWQLGKGTVTTLGFRPRDDQAASLGKDVRTWYEILAAVGAYPSSNPAGVADNTEVLSRTGAYFVGRFPNGAIAIAPHLKHVVESWPGGFHRNAAEDAKALAGVTLPSTEIALHDFHVAGHTVTFNGHHTLAFRAAADGALLAFAGQQCNAITVDGKSYKMAEHPLPLICWAPVPATRRVEGGAVLLVRVNGRGELRLPIAGLVNPVVVKQAAALGTAGPRQDAEYDSGILRFNVTGGATTYFILDN